MKPCRALRTVPALTLTALALSFGAATAPAAADLLPVPLPVPLPTSVLGIPLPEAPALPALPALPAVPAAPTPTPLPSVLPNPLPTPVPAPSVGSPAQPVVEAPAPAVRGNTAGRPTAGTPTRVTPVGSRDLTGVTPGLQLATGSMTERLSTTGLASLGQAPSLAQSPTSIALPGPQLAPSPTVITQAASGTPTQDLPALLVVLAVAAVVGAAAAQTLVLRSRP